MPNRQKHWRSYSLISHAIKTSTGLSKLTDDTENGLLTKLWRLKSVTDRQRHQLVGAAACDVSCDVIWAIRDCIRSASLAKCRSRVCTSRNWWRSRVSWAVFRFYIIIVIIVIIVIIIIIIISSSSSIKSLTETTDKLQLLQGTVHKMWTNKSINVLAHQSHNSIVLSNRTEFCYQRSITLSDFVSGGTGHQLLSAMWCSVYDTYVAGLVSKLNNQSSTNASTDDCI